MGENICPECKAQINDSMRICLKCGYPLDEKYATFKRNERKAIKQAKLTGLIILGLLFIVEIIMSVIGISYSSFMFIGIAILGLVVFCFCVGNIYVIRRENQNEEEERKKNLRIQQRNEKEQSLEKEWKRYVEYTTRVSGGGGGGSSVGGAIVGGLIAGDAGAVIGSRKQTEAIKSEVVTHDSRKTIIRYYKDNQIFAITYSGFSVYEYLLTKIPEKDLLTIQLNANKNSTSVKQVEESKKVVTVAGNIKEKLETIKNLYDSGLITEEEYAKKKDDILSKI